MTPIIEFKNYTFKYRSQSEPTLRDIDLKVYPGEKVLIVGPSGSGKSTLVHCINGMVPFSFPGESSGTLTVGGKEPAKTGIFGMSKIVGTVLQDTDGQFIGLTVAEDVAFALENDCVAQDEMFRLVDEVAEVVDIKTLLSHAPTELSGGQKQRVSMAGVLVDDVDILLFDEPLANLDPATGKRAIDLIDRICRERDKTVIIIEHRLEDALYRDVDRIVVIGEGRVAADMTPDELLASDILEKEGIREPLYVTALKHAGCQLRAQDKLQHVETMDIAPYREQVRAWFEEVRLPETKARKNAALEVLDLDFSYITGNPVLSNIDFRIGKGEMLAIVGKNGAGKSTLSNLICGFINPDKGRILLNESDISTKSIKERGEVIGLVMQNPNQMISKPMIFDEVALGLRVRGVPEDEVKERVYEKLKICGLYPFRNWPVSFSARIGAELRAEKARYDRLHPCDGSGDPDSGRADGGAGLPALHGDHGIFKAAQRDAWHHDHHDHPRHAPDAGIYGPGDRHCGRAAYRGRYAGKRPDRRGGCRPCLFKKDVALRSGGKVRD